MSTLSATCECTKRGRTFRGQPPPSNKPPTPICYATEVEKTPIEEIAASTYPSRTPTKNDNFVFFKSLIHGVPDQASPDHNSASYRIVGHLGEISGVDQDSLG